MGTISRVLATATVSGVKLTDPKVLEKLEALQVKARKLGFVVEATPTEVKAATVVQNWLTENRDGLGFFIGVAKDQSEAAPGEVILSDDGDSGRAYDLPGDLRIFIEFLKTEKLTLNGVFYREGPEVGDLQRIIVEDNKITNDEIAKLIFSDGTEYS
jgi:hypothetical protein